MFHCPKNKVFLSGKLHFCAVFLSSLAWFFHFVWNILSIIVGVNIQTVIIWYLLWNLAKAILKLLRHIWSVTFEEKFQFKQCSVNIFSHVWLKLKSIIRSLETFHLLLVVLFRIEWAKIWLFLETRIIIASVVTKRKILKQLWA